MGLFGPQDLTIKVKANSGVDLTSATALPSASFASGAVELNVKTLEIKEGEQTFAPQYYTGEDAVGYQSQAKIRTVKQPAELSMTIDNNSIGDLYAELADATQAIVHSTVDYTMVKNGSAARKEVDISIVADNGTDYAEWIFVNAELQDPASNLTGTDDGRIETPVNFKSLAKDFRGPITKD